ncbi:hypothetical protein J2Z69_001864 [Paenibacillus shirakamiensis]|uniref:Uncharacterized protein n=1 Tax=Paenibacillus shirakamiensis TaxID=1265935 RepID=A0ABS4JGJ5_9BACL|nr:hypothetical protein [Paenibacillus shirakamiensis]MBP2000833.1 hypothetical protein [Paenibacillus shirakamiensis]
MRIFLKWLIYMIPGLLGQIYITTHFHPPRNTSLFLSVPLFIFFSLINLMAYHLFFVPKKIKKKLLRSVTLLSKREHALELDNSFKKFITEARDRQATFNGFRILELKRLEETALKKRERLTYFVTILGWIFYIFFLQIIIFNILTIGLHIEIFYIECVFGVLLLLLFMIFREQKIEWEVQAHTLKRCIQKCGEKDIFEFDNSY